MHYDQELERHLWELLQPTDLDEKGLRLLEFACYKSYNDLLGKHKASRRYGYGTAQVEDAVTRLIML